LSARNLQATTLITASKLNTYSVMDAGVMVLTESALAQVNEVLTK